MNQKLLYIPLFTSLLLTQTPTLAVKSPHLLSQTTKTQPSCEIVPEGENELGGSEYSQQQLKTLASRITMKVIGDNNGGSGTIIAKNGNKYLVVTNFHVIRGVKSIRLQGFDGKSHTAKIVPDNKFEKFDLALLEFETNQNYCLTEVADFVPDKDTEVVASGFSADQGKMVFRTGDIQQISQSPLKGGYRIGYSSDIDQGMSGGPILHSSGILIGINGKSSYPILNTGYVYQNGEKPTNAEIQEMRKVSWGVPIHTFLAQVNPQIFTDYNTLPRPKVAHNIPDSKKLAPWLQKINARARKFTVKIDSSSGGNSSGIIIAREGNTYTVLTAAHVLCESENGVSQCPENTYTVMTHDGEKYRVENSTIEREEGVDLGVLKFTVENKTATSQTYPIATLADYNPNKDDYVFTVGYPKLGNHSPWRFSPGHILNKTIGLLSTRQPDFQSAGDGKLQTSSSLRGGYDLVHTSITYGGMSGGPLIDSQGRVIGIHGYSESEQAIDDKTGDCGVNVGCKVKLGSSLGISISTFLAHKLGVQAQNVEDTPAQQLTKRQKESMTEVILSVDVPKGNAKASQWLERGNQLWRLRRYKEAVKAFDEAIKQEPAFVYLAYYGKGLALFWDGKAQESITAFEQAAKLKPDFADTWRLLRTAYRELKQPEKALVAIEKAIQLQPKNPNLYNEKFGVLYRLKRYAEAEAAITKAIQINPNDAGAYYNRGILYQAQGNYSAALSDYNQALAKDEKNLPAITNIGLIKYEQGDTDAAIKQWQKSLVINNESAEVNLALAVALYSKGKSEEAYKLAKIALKLDKSFADVQVLRKNLWGERLINNAQKLLSSSQMKTVLSQLP